MSHHPDQARLFDEAMVSSSELINRAILDAYDFSGFATLVDVAGGYGSTLCAILAKHAALRGTLFEVPHVARKARHSLNRRGCRIGVLWRKEASSKACQRGLTPTS